MSEHKTKRFRDRAAKQKRVEVPSNPPIVITISPDAPIKVGDPVVVDLTKVAAEIAKDPAP
jgi:hypothetical protein